MAGFIRWLVITSGGIIRGAAKKSLPPHYSPVFKAPMSNPPAVRHENRILIGIFCAALLAHFWFVTRNWTMGFMPGHEFRQAQTAFISHFIDRNNDFSLLYEAPIVGKPWVSILLEVPLYEWGVVWLSRATDWPHVVSARTLTLACFYLTLPACWLLLGRLGLSRSRRLLPLTLILLCPVYIFYSRAFLMESMELMFCAWWLYGFVRMMDARRWPWFLLATVAGTGASLVKSATYAVWLVPAAAWVAWSLWRQLRDRAGGGALAQTVFWGLAGVTVPLGALKLWVALTDPIKETHTTAWIFTSKNLSVGNWGLQDLAARFSQQTWGTLLQRWSEALMPPWVILTALAATLILLPAQRWRIAGLAAVFFVAQLLFPFAYAYQEYYFYACAVFLLAGLGFGLHGLLDTGLPRWLCWLLVLVLPAVQLQNYLRLYLPQQLVRTSGDISLTRALRELTPRESVLVVSGADWAAILPFYAQRRSLMILNGRVNDREYLKRAFGDLYGEDVSALVLVRDERRNTMLRDLAVRMFNLDPQPTFSHEIADVYSSRWNSAAMRKGLADNGYGDLKFGAPEVQDGFTSRPLWVNAGIAKGPLEAISPAPMRAHFGFGMGSFVYEERRVLNAHPDTDVWLRAPSTATRIEWEFGMVSSSWGKDGPRTDGTEYIITGSDKREIYRRELDPVNRPEDRGLHRAVIDYQPLPGEILHFRTGPRGGNAFDWAYWVKIEVK